MDLEQDFAGPEATGRGLGRHRPHECGRSPFQVPRPQIATHPGYGVDAVERKTAFPVGTAAPPGDDDPPCPQRV